ncbi:DUF2256 domain-containing protein [Mycolicibacterium palauense]|uniref:hypothetical protein n=1 Tax=Mycolicibacterium palauense TaxID=2034511 RepID=UPI000BFF06E0|nr:hypothetical protein [Mycolicibacterium palauense]
MQKPCAVCGRPFEAQRPQAKYCGETCKKRAQRAGTAGARDRKKPRRTAAAPPATTPTTEHSDPPAPNTEAYASVGVVAATVKELSEADRLDTVLGQLALKLAVRLEASTFDTGSSFAALSKELRAVTAAALAGAAVEDDEVDELQKRRDEKKARAAAAATS